MTGVTAAGGGESNSIVGDIVLNFDLDLSQLRALSPGGNGGLAGRVGDDTARDVGRMTDGVADTCGHDGGGAGQTPGGGQGQDNVNGKLALDLLEMAGREGTSLEDKMTLMRAAIEALGGNAEGPQQGAGAPRAEEPPAGDDPKAEKPDKDAPAKEEPSTGKDASKCGAPTGEPNGKDAPSGGEQPGGGQGGLLGGLISALATLVGDLLKLVEGLPLPEEQKTAIVDALKGLLEKLAGADVAGAQQAQAGQEAPQT